MNRWSTPEFKSLHAYSKLLLLHIEDNQGVQKEFELSMKVLRVALNPLTDAEIKAAFKEIEHLLTFSHDRKKVSVKPLKRVKKGETAKLMDIAPKYPPLAEIEIYFIGNGSTKALAKKFFNFYESNGWRVGRNPLKKWRAAASNFIDGQNQTPKGNNTNSTSTVINF